MYHPDCLAIREYAQQGPQQLFRVGLFVQATINQHFEHVPTVMADFDLYGLDAKYFSEQQRYALSTLASESGRLHRTLQGWLEIHSGDPWFTERQALLALVAAGCLVRVVLSHEHLGLGVGKRSPFDY